MLGLEVLCRARPWHAAQAAWPARLLSTSARLLEKEAAPSWMPLSRRVGLITRKMGMTTLFTPDGKKVPATVLYVDSNQISMHVGTEKQENGEDAPYTALQVAAVRARNQTNPRRGHLRNAGIDEPKRVLREFRVTPDAVVPLGTQLSAAHFVPGQDVDVRAITRGKGFQGVMKRHNFKGGNASHGASLAHRTPGSIGQNQDPGRVFPGKKMPGRMGGTAHRTVQNARVLRIDVKNDLIFVKGMVPGPEGGVVYVQDALKNLVKSAYFTFRKGKTSTGELIDPARGVQQYLSNGVQNLPFPAGTKELAQTLPDVIEVGPSA